LITQIIHLLDQRFTIKDFGDLYFFLGIEVYKHDNGLLLTQSRYIYSILDHTQMYGAKPVNTHMATASPLLKLSGEPFADPHLYRSVVGALQYATITRPECCELRISVHAQSLYMSLDGSETNSMLSKRYEQLWTNNHAFYVFYTACLCRLRLGWLPG
jgi:Reverse transcriptase (RNA-dependent DNA polymerase)